MEVNNHQTHFEHIQSAHCESGVTVSLLNYYGKSISEPLIFGLGAGLGYYYFPFIKLQGKPTVVYRNWFLSIFKKSIRKLGGEPRIHSFSSIVKGSDFLDEKLKEGIPVAAITNVYYLEYLPENFRFQFSGHNLVIYGKTDSGLYTISDPIVEEATTLTLDQLNAARFAKAFPQPKGKLYYFDNIENVDLQRVLPKDIWESIEDVCYKILVPPFPWIGSRGMLTLSKHLLKLPKRKTDFQVKTTLANIVQMQEVIGTGGAGYRFLYAAFLQEAADLANAPQLKEMAVRLTQIGDKWRTFASELAKVIKDRDKQGDAVVNASLRLKDLAREEYQFFTALRNLNPYRKKTLISEDWLPKKELAY